jgi:xylitol oxidase
MSSPATIDELRRVVERADRVHALGSRHSFNDIADTPGVLLDTRGLEPSVQIDHEARTAKVVAGMTYATVAERLQSAGFALANLASLPHISVAGAIATATHGSGLHNQNLAAAVASLELVTAGGDLVTLDRGHPDFAGVVVGLGAFGVVATATLDIVPTFDVRQDVFEQLPWASLESHFDDVAGSAYSVSFFADWSADTVRLAWLKSRRQDGAAPADDFFGARPAVVAHHPIPGVDPVHTTEQLGRPGPWQERLPHFRSGFTPSVGVELQSEYLLPRRLAGPAISAMRGIGPMLVELLEVTEIRTVAADELWLSSAYDRDSVAFHFTWQQHQPEVEALLGQVEATLAPFEARPHWGKVFVTEPARMRALWAHFDDVSALINRYDPAAKFSNDYLRRVGLVPS